MKYVHARPLPSCPVRKYKKNTNENVWINRGDTAGPPRFLTEVQEAGQKQQGQGGGPEIHPE